MPRLPNDYNITNIVNYLRRSRQDVEREKRTGEDTLAEQKQLMDRVLLDYGIPYVQKMEIGSGDKISTRPVFQQILEELRAGVYDAIAVKEISRLGRGSYADMGQIYDLLRQKRIFIITPYRIYDPNNATDARQIRFELFLSREEFETTRERLMGARYNYAMQGKWMAGTVPFGYRFNEETQRLIPDEEEAKIVRMIFELFTRGLNGRPMGARAIASYFTRIGIKSPTGRAKWQPLVIQRIIEKPVYIGQVRFRTTEKQDGKVVKRPEEEWIVVNDAHEPIIDESVYYEAQRLREKRHVPRTKLDFSPCELAGLVVCTKCGHRMVRQYNVQKYKRVNGEVSTYEKEFLWCTTAGCTFVKYRDVENQLLEVLKELRDMDDEELSQFMKAALENDRNRDDDSEDVLKSIERRRKELQARLDFVYEKYESGIYSDEEFLRRKQVIEREISDVERLVATTLRPTVESEESYDWDSVRGTINTVLDLYSRLQDKTSKNELLREIFDVVELTVTRKGQGRTPTQFTLDVRFKNAFLVRPDAD